MRADGDMTKLIGAFRNLCEDAKKRGWGGLHGI
jgi:hypothetical protein